MRIPRRDVWFWRIRSLTARLFGRIGPKYVARHGLLYHPKHAAWLDRHEAGKENAA